MTKRKFNKLLVHLMNCKMESKQKQQQYFSLKLYHYIFIYYFEKKKSYFRMKECKVAGKNVLLVKDSDNVYAIGSKCTHLGAPLKNGVSIYLFFVFFHFFVKKNNFSNKNLSIKVVADGHVRCPWHGACFSLKVYFLFFYAL